MMNKTIKELERDRINRIKDLNSEDIKSYILNLHKNRFNSYENHNKELADFYGEKIKEVFRITEGTYVNLDNYSDNCEIDLLYSKLIITNNNEIASRVLSQSLSLLDGEIQLNKDLKLYRLLKQIDNSDLSEAISLLKTSMTFTIFSMQKNLDYNREESISIIQRNVKEDKHHCLKLYHEGGRRQKLLVDYGYIEALNTLSEAINIYDKQCNSFIAIQREILNLFYGVGDVDEIDFADIFMNAEGEA